MSMMRSGNVMRRVARAAPDVDQPVRLFVVRGPLDNPFHDDATIGILGVLRCEDDLVCVLSPIG